ncbi:hypothetical protein DV737_g610, partial [Chaetothyriales sp. CBS 132003]
MSVSNDGSESVDQFLARVASLSRRNDEEVAERNRKMEEEMMQARRQRRARREALRSTPFESSRPLPSPPPEKPTTPTFPPVSTTALSRSGTLSWQKRPLSRDGGSIRGWPLSTARGVFREPSEKTLERAVEAAKPAKPDEQEDKSKPKPESELEPSRADIAASLAARDPSWFRQTADRGIGSAAYRKSNEDPGIATASLNRTANILGSTGRAPSPTKGLGGFVQSAMMRRSDSVSKRWSVQATGLNRGDSVAGNRPTFNPPAATPSLGRPRVITRDSKPNIDGASSPLSSSRPTSAHAADVVADPVKDPVPENEARPLGSEQHPDVETKQERPDVETEQERPDVETKQERPDVETKQERPVTPSSESLLSRSPSSTFDSVTTGGLLRHPPPGSPSKTPESLARPGSLTDQPKVKTETHSSHAAENALKLQESAITRASREFNVAQKPSPSPSQANRPKEQVRETADEGIEPVSHPTTATQDRTLAGDSAVQGSADKKSVAPKPKPQTPPKLDFRSTLRSRQVDTTASKNNEPEFKAVFGKLKPTQTQNYVAPDALKQNITQGKAALHVTGGPQQTKRVDELKESLLSRKEEMKAGGGSIHKRPNIRGVKEPSEDKGPAVPEALARRKTLHKTSPSPSSASTKPRVEPPKLTASKPAVVTAQKAGLPVLKPAAPTPVQKTDKPLLLPLGSTSAPSRSSEGQKESPVAPAEKPAPPGAPERKLSEKAISLLPPSDPISPTGSTAPDRELTKTTSNKLAGRLNPALAGLIARGSNSSSRAVQDVRSGDVSPATRGPAAPMCSEDPDGSSGLTHVTKGRAKGPKRRAPKGGPTSANLVEKARTKAPESPSTGSGPAPVKPMAVSPAKQLLATTPDTEIGKPAITTTPKLSSSQKSVMPSSKPAAIAPTAPAASAASNGVVVREKPRVASKSSELRKVSENARLATHQSPPPGHLQENASLQTGDADKGLSQELTPSPSPRPMATPARSPEKSMPLTPSQSRINTPKVAYPVAAAAALPVLKATRKTGFGLGISADPKPLPVNSELTPPPEKEGKVDQVTRTAASHVQQVLLDTFGAVPRVAERLQCDTAAFLEAHSGKAQRIKTIGNKIMKVTGDGKQADMPSSQEHILYEDSMYLCVHKFESAGSTLTEVYLWTGDAVPEAAVEDAQIFCRKVARDNDAKLQVLRQGMESGPFLSALGGILIVRKNTASDLSMLCGRRHRGHIVFDQVEFSPTSLCSGFSYLISTKFGKLYLWIGEGSCADEYGAARLIGTDLGLTGEIEEVAEGKEPAAFWTAFSSPSAKQQYQPSRTWAIRARNEHSGFPCKLYRIEQERPKSSGGFWALRSSSPPKSLSKVSLQEIDPFSQRDLNSDCVHLLDAYAALYVIPGKPSPLKSADFVSALHIAQELAVLTPSMQGRPLLPSCQVAFGEPPRDCQAAFRKWTPAGVSGARGPSACFDIADVMKVLA